MNEQEREYYAMADRRIARSRDIRRENLGAISGANDAFLLRTVKRRRSKAEPAKLSA